MNSASSVRDIRKKLMQVMPKEAFEPQPWRGGVALLTFSGILAAGVAIAKLDLPWYADLLLSLAMGQGVTSVVLLGHEAMHRAVVRSRWGQQLFGWIGFAPLLITPGMWRAWHVQAHHGHTNQFGADPDALFDVSQRHDSLVHFVRTWMVPGSGHPLSWISFLWSFSMEGLVFLFVLCDDPKVAKDVHFNRRRERILTILMIAGWVALGVRLGWVDAFWVLLLPLMTANLTLMLYISTQHWLRPRMDEDNPFLSTVSVKVPWIFDFIHYGFSWHQEHHIFPGMSHKFAPLLREKLEEIAPQAIAVMPIGAALRELYTTPPLYADDTHLTYADKSVRVNLNGVAARHGLPFDASINER